MPVVSAKVYSVDLSSLGISDVGRVKGNDSMGVCLIGHSTVYYNREQVRLMYVCMYGGRGEGGREGGSACWTHSTRPLISPPLSLCACTYGVGGLDVPCPLAQPREQEPGGWYHCMCGLSQRKVGGSLVER